MWKTFQVIEMYGARVWTPYFVRYLFSCLSDSKSKAKSYLFDKTRTSQQFGIVTPTTAMMFFYPKLPPIAEVTLSSISCADPYSP